MSINKQEWLAKVKGWKNKWTQFPSEIEDNSNGISLYKIAQVLNQNLENDSVIVAEAGSCGYVLSQGLELKENQRYILDSGQMALGAWPMAIGVCLARDKKTTILCVGDGSFQTNNSALGTIKYHKLPIVILVWNNSGYLSIRNTAKSFYENRLIGTDSEHGLFFPDLDKIADCYDFRYLFCDKAKYLDETIKFALKYNEPCIVEIKCDPNQKIIPTLAMKDGKSCPLHDLYPFLSEEEMKKEMINE